MCYGEIQGVKSITVKHFVNDDLVNEIEDTNYQICLNRNCYVVYFNKDQGQIFNKEDIKIPIWFKKDADPKYICYCNNVTEEQIIDAVINEGAKNMKDIIRITGAMKNGECQVKNPLSKCCGPVIQKTIKETIELNV